MLLTDYFTEEKIVLILCKYRSIQASKRHDLHMVRNFSVHPRNNKILPSQKKAEFIQISEMFPTRRNWKKLFPDERKKCTNSHKANQLRLYNSYKRTKRDIQLNGNNEPVWYTKLISFIYEIQQHISYAEIGNLKISSPRISGIKKDEKDGLITYRPIAVYDLKSKIICSQTAKYFTDFFDEYFLDCSYAFRAVHKINGCIPSHHDCIKAIAKKRKDSTGLWAAECDIQKFFDIVNHKHLLEVFEKFVIEIKLIHNKVIDQKSILVFRSFLDSYSFQKNILDLNNDLEWFEKNNLPKGEFGWVEEELNAKFGSNYCSENLLGVPQGNAISCFVANLILHEVDKKVLSSVKDIFYIRYCDDMILLHRNKSKSQIALNNFMQGLLNNYLLYHPPAQNINYKLDSSIFWNKSKSKLPYFWGDKNLAKTNIPWLSFVGYQINFDGRIRIRKKTLIKETKKQVFETQNIIINLGKSTHYQDIGDHHSRWSKRQIFFSLQQRLISMSVGRVKIYNHTNPLQQGLCWTNGFKGLNKNKIVSKQLRYLDRRRNHQLVRLKKSLGSITKKSVKTTFQEEKVFYGSAFSYFNFFKHK